MKRLNQKGFTLAELLIVVAIIAVLVAIAIPVFNSQLEKSRETTDLANIRAAYAEIMAAAVEGTADDVASVVDTDGTIEYDSGTYTAVIEPKQTQTDWEGANHGVSVASLRTVNDADSGTGVPAATKPDKNYQLVFTVSTGALVVTAEEVTAEDP